MLAIDGSLGWRGDSTPLVLKLSGKNVLVSDTRDLRAVDRSRRHGALRRRPADHRHRQRRRAERASSISNASTTACRPRPTSSCSIRSIPKRTASSPLDLDLTLALGDDVRLNGFGLEGTLGGSLRVRQRPGREMIATGTLEVGGRYEAYGQELDITRGGWCGRTRRSPIRCSTSAPNARSATSPPASTSTAAPPRRRRRVWTDPASDESEALAYLALGRPLSSASGDEGRQLDAASRRAVRRRQPAGLAARRRIGLDDAGVMDSRALGGSVFGVGKYLSPKLYVGYGVSLLGTGQVLTLKYLLRKGFDIEIESSTIENRGSVNWRKEK